MNKQKQRVAMVAGHICLDITPLFDAADTFSLAETIIPGNMVPLSGVSISAGGAVANVGLAMTKLGQKAILGGMAGRDYFGDLLRQVLLDQQADCTLVQREGVTTSYSIVLTKSGCDRAFLHASGANNSFCADDVDYEQLKICDLFHFGYPPVMKNMYWDNGLTLKAIFERAKAAGVTSSLDMTMPNPNSEAGRADWKRILQSVLPYVDLFVPSYEEILFMLDRETYNQKRRDAGCADFIDCLDIDHLTAISATLKSWGARVVLIKCGAKGSFLSTSSKDNLRKMGRGAPKNLDEWDNLALFEESYSVPLVASATGAGDTFIAAFLSSLLSGCSAMVSHKNAAAAGAICVGTHDVACNIPSLEMLRAKTSSGWRKNRFAIANPQWTYDPLLSTWLGKNPS